MQTYLAQDGSGFAQFVSAADSSVYLADGTHPNAVGRHVLADKSYFSGCQILACREVGITTTIPRPESSGSGAGACM